MAAADEFYLRYYVGHQGKFGHEFLEFEFRPDGKMRYANNSNYKNDTMIRKEVFVNEGVIEALKKVIKDSEIMQEDDRNWPMPDRKSAIFRGFSSARKSCLPAAFPRAHHMMRQNGT